MLYARKKIIKKFFGIFLEIFLKLTNSLRARAPDPVRAPAECNDSEHCDKGLDDDQGV